MDKDRDLIAAERENIIQKITSDPRFSHGVFGCFSSDGSVGHYPHGLKGPSDFIEKKLFRAENPYIAAFGNQTNYLEFKARVLFGVSDQGEFFYILSFNDRQGDKRGASHTDYALVIPKEESETAGLIKKDPSILVEIFRKMYPRYDRSNGTLMVDPDFPMRRFSEV